MHAPRTRYASGVLAVALVASTLALGVTAAAAEPDDRAHVVRDGDTLSEIAARYGVSTEQLATANQVADPNLIRTGTRLVVPATGGGATSSARRVHVVADGDSFWAIAHEHGTTVAALARANGRSPSSVLLAGDRLVIPAETASGTGVPARLVRSGRIGMRPLFVRWAERNGISPALLQAVCYLESGWQHHVVSSTGAVGVCQLMPDTVEFSQQMIGTSLDPEDPEDNIRMGARTLRWLLDQTGGNTRQALAAYYQGLTALRRSGPYPETVAYVDAVESLVKRF